MWCEIGRHAAAESSHCLTKARVPRRVHLDDATGSQWREDRVRAKPPTRRKGHECANYRRHSHPRIRLPVRTCVSNFSDNPSDDWSAAASASAGSLPRFREHHPRGFPEERPPVVRLQWVRLWSPARCPPNVRDQHVDVRAVAPDQNFVPFTALSGSDTSTCVTRRCTARYLAIPRCSAPHGQSGSIGRYLIRRYPAGGHHQRGEYEDPTHDGARHE